VKVHVPPKPARNLVLNAATFPTDAAISSLAVHAHLLIHAEAGASKKSAAARQPPAASSDSTVGWFLMVAKEPSIAARVPPPIHAEQTVKLTYVAASQPRAKKKCSSAAMPPMDVEEPSNVARAPTTWNVRITNAAWLLVIPLLVQPPAPRAAPSTMAVAKRSIAATAPCPRLVVAEAPPTDAAAPLDHANRKNAGPSITAAEGIWSAPAPQVPYATMEFAWVPRIRAPGSIALGYVAAESAASKARYA